MAGVMVALLASCEKSESEVEVVPSTPEELLEFCQGNWVLVSYVDFSGKLWMEEPGARHAIVFENEELRDAKTDDEDTHLCPLSTVYPLVSNDGKELIYGGFSTAMGTCTGVCCYAGKNQLTLGLYTRNIRGDGPFGGLYQQSTYERTDLPLLGE